jgi:hypothetical protein
VKHLGGSISRWKRVAAASLVLVSWGAAAALAQADVPAEEAAHDAALLPATDSAVPGAFDRGTPVDPGASPVSLGRILGSEAHRYVHDSADILFAPLHWSRRSWTEAAIVVASIVALGHEDATIEDSFQRNRSSTTNSVSRAITPLGSATGVGLSFAALGGGLLFQDPALRDIGRDAVEAELISGGIVTPVIKWVIGRTRPSQGGDADEYKPFSSRQSFPSGHTTEAFTLASVVATRSHGWVVPTIAYGLAATVGLSRMNDRAHFASDVLAGAVIGTVVGRSVVHRHTGSSEHASSWSILPVPARRGGGLAIRLDSGPG